MSQDLSPKEIIRKALARAQGLTEDAARILGLSTEDLEDRIQRHSISLDQTQEMVITGTY